MKLKLNPEFMKRHLFVVVLMVALGGWFGYDGFIGYPATPANKLYVSIEKCEPREGTDLEAFKRQKIQTQYGFTVLALLAAAVVGIHLWKVASFDFEFDDGSFTCNGSRHLRGEILSVDRSRWDKKGIAVLILSSGEKITLDAWHHHGVKEFVRSLKV